MKFSDYFKFKPSKSEKWFDPVLSIDTPLFLDPFLLYAQQGGPFRGSHKEIIQFFNSVFTLIAQAKGNPASVRYQKAVELLLFHEVEELCLGYTSAGTKGSGAGKELANLMASSIWEAIEAGLTEITHFEEISIIREGIGADRISDITAGLIRHRLARYTSVICKVHKIPVRTVAYRRGFYDVNSQRWEPLRADLPDNPYNEKPILLVPQYYLRDLPTINADDFWNYCYSNENETIRNEFSYDVTSRVSKQDIIKLARSHPEFRRDYIRDVEGQAPDPYDLTLDEKGYIRWYEATASYCGDHPLAFSVSKSNDFFGVTDELVGEFRHFVEENKGWQLLWNDNGTRKSEKASQLLFLGIVKHYCKANDIDISREADIGKGPVDFKASRGFRLRVLFELKLASNTKFWNGLRRQLPAYMKSELIRCGYFVIVVFSDEDLNRLKDIRNVVGEVNKATGYEIKEVVVDARAEKPSASKL